MGDLATLFAGVWSNIAGGVHAPLGFRVVVQPLAAAFFAIRAGRQDALEGKPLFFWAVLTDSKHRRERLREAWKDVGKVFASAVIIDIVYQVIVEHWVYPAEALMVGVILAVLPYLIFRGIVNRLLRNKARAAHPRI